MFRSARLALGIYKRKPLDEIDGIPVFSKRDRYVENYEQIASDHINAMKGNVDNPFMDSDLWQKLEESTRALVHAHVAKGSRLLDVGVGLGRLLEPLETFDRYGIDISADYLGSARDKGIDVALARIEDMPYKSGMFDGVVCCDVLEHVFDLYECTKRILDVVRPGGIIIVRVPFKEDLTGYLDPSNPYEFVHLRNFDVESLKMHFTRIFDCEWLEHRFAAPYLTNPTRLLLRVPPASNPIFEYLKQVSGIRHPLYPLRMLCSATEEDLHTWLNGIEKDYPEEFGQIVQALVMPLEVNTVLRKPL